MTDDSNRSTPDGAAGRPLRSTQVFGTRVDEEPGPAGASAPRARAATLPLGAADHVVGPDPAPPARGLEVTELPPAAEPSALPSTDPAPPPPLGAGLLDPAVVSSLGAVSLPPTQPHVPPMRWLPKASLPPSAPRAAAAPEESVDEESDVGHGVPRRTPRHRRARQFMGQRAEQPLAQTLESAASPVARPLAPPAAPAPDTAPPDEPELGVDIRPPVDSSASFTPTPSTDASLSARLSMLDPRLLLTRRRLPVRWVLGLLLLAVLALLVLTVGRKKLRSLSDREAPASSSALALPEGVASAASATRAGRLGDAAELIGALPPEQRSLAATLLAEAELSLVRGDVADLLVRCAADVAGAPRDRWRESRARELEAAARALDAIGAAPGLDVTPARIDLARLRGDVRGARALVTAEIPGVEGGRRAYTLARLEGADATADPGVVILRLQEAIDAGERSGRAWAALACAEFARGDAAAARQALRRAGDRPLGGELVPWLERAAPVSSASAAPSSGPRP